MDPGIEKMMEFAKRQRMRARLPPPEEMEEACKQFFESKWKRKQKMNDDQARLAAQSLRYCLSVTRENEEKGESAQYLLGYQSIHQASKTLLRDTNTSDAAIDFARTLYEVASTLHRTNSIVRTQTAFQAYIHTLSLGHGSAQQARELVMEREKYAAVTAVKSNSTEQATLLDDESEATGVPEGSTRDSDGLSSMTRGLDVLWPLVLRGFVYEGNEDEVLRTLAMIDDRGLQQHREIMGIMLDFSINRNDVNGIKQWWASYSRRWQTAHQQEFEGSPELQRSDELFGEKLNKVLKWCLTRDEVEYGQEIVRQIMINSPAKPVWDAVFIWAAGTKKSVDEIDRMMSVMEKSNESISNPTLWRTPDIATINGLVEFAISRNDPYMAERFIALGKDRKIQPDARTYVLQMDYRLGVDDVDGALIAYKNLQSMDLSSNDDVQTVNRLVVALCKTQRHDFDTIMNVAADLSDRRVRFEAATVTALSLLHLQRDEFHDVVDLLNTHAFHYSSNERASIRSAIVDFALNPNSSTAQAWESYTILRSVFDELPRPERTELMTSFFGRERPDMGVHVFQNMRMHSRADTIPTIDTYVAAFMSLAKLRELESLEVIHNLLKLDYNINVTTYLYNALIIAYTACGEPRKALMFWLDIVASREGPSYNSIHVALRACEKAPFGDMRAKEIWNMLRRRNVELDHGLWASYIAALAGNGDNKLALSTLEEAVEKGEVEVDAFLLGSLFAGAAGQAKQAEVEVWGKENYPDQWATLEAMGIVVQEDFMRYSKIDRSVAP